MSQWLREHIWHLQKKTGIWELLQKHMFTFLPHLHRSTRCRTGSTHTSSPQSAPRWGWGFATTEFLGTSQNSVVSSFAVVLTHWSCAWAEIRHFCLAWVGSLPVSGIPVLTLNQMATGGGRNRGDSEQRFANVCFFLEAYQTQTFSCFLKTYGDKWVVPLHVTSPDG